MLVTKDIDAKEVLNCIAQIRVDPVSFVPYLQELKSQVVEGFLCSPGKTPL
jgi:hypothetical protein